MSSSVVDENYLPRRDSLEYFIKFPPPNSTDECLEYDFNFTSDEVNTPVVVLLGWIGCEDRYLMKYSKIYEDRGFITVRYTTPTQNIVWKRDALQIIGQKIVKLLYDMNFEANPIILHLFSNGGAYLYKHVDLAMKEFQTPLYICGIIFDSAPGDLRFLSVYRMISSLYGKERRFASLVTLVITLTLTAKYLAENLFLGLKSIFTSTPFANLNAYQDLKYFDNYIPQLFLYSDADKLISSKDIKSFASFRQKIGVPVDIVHFPDAEHVKLYLMYPKKYIQCVCTFISNCLMNIPEQMGANKKFD